MSSRTAKCSAAQIEADASDWLVRRESGLLDAERAEYEFWLAADPRHRAAFIAAEQAWRLLDRPRQTGRDDEMIQALGRRARGRRRRRAVGAAFALAAMVLVALQWNPRRTPAASISAPVVITVEKRVLPDGGIVELKPGAELSVDYSGELRRVTLRSGEALFHVAENKQRAFVVSAGEVQVRAVGTAFLVSMQTAKVDVIVTQGCVAVAPPARTAQSSDATASQTEPTLVSAGNRVSVELAPDAPALPVLPISPEEIAARLDWRESRVTFSDTALADAVALMNQHSQLQLRIDDPRLAQLPVNGIFRLGNTETLVRLLETGFGIKAERSGNTIALHRAP